MDRSEHATARVRREDVKSSKVLVWVCLPKRLLLARFMGDDSRMKFFPAVRYFFRGESSE